MARQAAALLPGARIDGDPAAEFAAVTLDSRRAGPGTAFAALRGERVDGLRFADDAVGRGATAVIADRERPEGLCAGATWITVAAPRRAVALLARELCGRPDERLAVAGVTGTNGKTTVTRLLAAALGAGGLRTGIVGTLGYEWPGTSIDAERTTPEAPDLYAYLAAMVEAGCDACALEVSSHALHRDRVAGLAFRVGVFTNLTPDHLDYHESLEAYFEAKASLFAGLDPDATAVINADDPHAEDLAHRTRARVLTYGFAEKAAWRIERVSPGPGRTNVGLRGPDGTAVDTGTPLPGRVNAANLAAAVAAATALGVPAVRAAEGAAAVAGVRGRFERVDEGQPFAVWVDYAHTEDALRLLLATVRETTAGRILLVFGCGGERDRSKRPRMGAVAAAGADRIVATSDNPRGEDPLAILDEIRPALAGSDHVIEPDRRLAIRIALDEARPGDAVVIAGKGHETEQVIGDRHEHFDDRDVAGVVLREARAGSGGR